MGLRGRIKKRIRRVIDGFSGEYSANTPEHTVEVQRHVGAREDVQILKPRYVRQREQRKAERGKGTDAAEE